MTTMTNAKKLNKANLELEELAAPDLSEYTDSRALWSEILPGLWQGGTHDDDVIHRSRSRRSEAFIEKTDFDTVITLYAWAQPVDWFVKELRYGFWDSDSHLPVEQVLEVAAVAHAEWTAGRQVLIRCQAGLNRSGLITGLVLMMSGHSADEAIDLIRRNRSRWALCNGSFERFLRNMDADTLARLAS